MLLHMAKIKRKNEESVLLMDVLKPAIIGLTNIVNYLLIA